MFNPSWTLTATGVLFTATANGLVFEFKLIISTLPVLSVLVVSSFLFSSSFFISVLVSLFDSSFSFLSLFKKKNIPTPIPTSTNP